MVPKVQSQTPKFTRRQVLSHLIRGIVISSGGACIAIDKLGKKDKADNDGSKSQTLSRWGYSLLLIGGLSYTLPAHHIFKEV